jgi:cell division protein ZipA
MKASVKFGFSAPAQPVQKPVEPAFGQFSETQDDRPDPLDSVRCAFTSRSGGSQALSFENSTNQAILCWVTLCLVTDDDDMMLDNYAQRMKTTIRHSANRARTFA